MTNVLILTTTRATARPFEYLEALLADIDEEQLPDDIRKFIVLDGTPAELEQLRAVVAELHTEGRPWEIVLYEKSHDAYLGGNKPAYWHVLELALTLGDDALVLEDDLESCNNATTRAVLFPVPSDVDIVQFYSGFSIMHPKTDAGLWRSPAKFAGTQSVKYPLRTLERLVEWKKASEFLKYTGSDQAIGLARSRLGLRLAHHVPDVYQHAGARSAVDAGTVLEAGITDGETLARLEHSLIGRTSVTWPGRSFDAMRLFACHELYK